MKNEKSKIEHRMQNMKKFYVKAGQLIDKLPDTIPTKTKNMLKNVVLGDNDLKQLMDGIDSHRPPRIFLIGRTGVGKSSLINAICGSYVASVSDTHSCTENIQIHKFMEGDRTLMEICDTRGIAESVSLDDSQSSEDMLIEQINEFSPDVAIFMLNCTHRDDVNTDVEFLKKLAKSYAAINQLKLPIVVVINKCDEMAPSRYKNPSDYPQKKIDHINDVVQYYKGIIIKAGLKIDNIIAVSSMIDWQTPDGTEISAEDIDYLPKPDIEHLQIAYDGRYQIEQLLDILEGSIQDFEAQMGLRMAARLNEVVHQFAKRLNTIFSGIAASIALTPIPVSDIYVLLILQTLLVSLIASLSGRDISLDTAKEFILSLGGIAGAGNAFRFLAQQASKFLNIFLPGAGSAVSSGIAAIGTSTIGKAAIAYYIDKKDIESARKVFEAEKNKDNYSNND